MDIDELIKLEEEPKEKYGNSKVLVRSRRAGATNKICYVSYRAQKKEFYTGIEREVRPGIGRIENRKRINYRKQGQ